MMRTGAGISVVTCGLACSSDLSIGIRDAYTDSAYTPVRFQVNGRFVGIHVKTDTVDAATRPTGEVGAEDATLHRVHEFVVSVQEIHPEVTGTSSHGRLEMSGGGGWVSAALGKGQFEAIDGDCSNRGQVDPVRR